MSNKDFVYIAKAYRRITSVDDGENVDANELIAQGRVSLKPRKSTATTSTEETVSFVDYQVVAYWLDFKALKPGDILEVDVGVNEKQTFVVLGKPLLQPNRIFCFIDVQEQELQ